MTGREGRVPDAELETRVIVQPSTEPVAAVARTRAAVADFLDELDLDECSPDVLLVVSELVTNVVKHAGGPPCLAVRHRRRPHRLTIEVTDSDGDHVPQVVIATGDEPSAPGDVGGWGLRLVDRVASRWGVRPGPSCTKAVWAEFDIDSGEGHP
jgi:anti-sigma regulatory factor (Ser/Thr protein kinase)